jgi:hypothetical protein
MMLMASTGGICGTSVTAPQASPRLVSYQVPACAVDGAQTLPPAPSPRSIYQELRRLHTRGEAVDILPAMNDQDCNRSPGGNVPRFALDRQGQNSHVWPRGRAMACRGVTLVLPSSAGLGYRRAGLNLQPSTDRAKGLLPARSDRVST